LPIDSIVQEIRPTKKAKPIKLDFTALFPPGYQGEIPESLDYDLKKGMIRGLIKYNIQANCVVINIGKNLRHYV